MKFKKNKEIQALIEQCDDYSIDWCEGIELFLKFDWSRELTADYQRKELLELARLVERKVPIYEAVLYDNIYLYVEPESVKRILKRLIADHEAEGEREDLYIRAPLFKGETREEAISRIQELLKQRPITIQ